MTIAPYDGGNDAGNLFDDYRREDERGEYWSGRDLQMLMDYHQWRDFSTVIKKAKSSLALVKGQETADAAFQQVNEVVDVRNLGKTDRENWRLSLAGAYLTAMAGDHLKLPVGKARIYFAAMTRAAELRMAQPPALDGRQQELLESAERLAARVLELERDAAIGRAFIGTGQDYSVREAGYILNRDDFIRKTFYLDFWDRGVGQARLFDMFREKKSEGGLEMVGEGDVPYSRHNGHLVLRPVMHFDFGEVTHTTLQLRVTPGGLRYLHKRLGGVDRRIPDMFPPAAGK